jgi:CHAT domain-containing protein
MNAECRFLLDWFAGSSAEVDLRASGEGGTYMLRYASPFRPTMRAPSQEIAADASDLRQINDDLDEFAARMIGVSRGGDVSTERPVDADLEELGRQIFDLVLPGHVQTDLRNREQLFVEIGTDDALLHYPWELMHDGEDFLCLKHFVGRFVNLDRTLELNGPTPYGPGFDLGDLRVLLISVPRPTPRGQVEFPRLQAVESESQAIVETLGAAGLRAEYLADRRATRTEVLRALRRPWHIIHFAGHASFDPADARRSSLMLDDENISVGALTAALRTQRAVLCVVNACETTRGRAQEETGDTMRGGAQPGDAAGRQAETWTDQYNIYGLARAFLETGSYLLGSRWMLNDTSAEVFARAFYSGLLIDGRPIGCAITAARKAVRDAADADDFSWASYVYYGDPRVCVKRETFEPPAGASVPPAQAEAGPQPDATPAAEPAAPAQQVEVERQPFDRLAQEYESLRSSMQSSDERTRKLSEIVAQARELGAEVDDTSLVSTLFAAGDAQRIVALAVIQARPDVRYFEHVLDAIEHSRSAFEQYHALLAMRLMLAQLSPPQEVTLSDALKSLSESETFFGTDRFLLARDILTRLGHTTPVGNPEFD